MTSHRYTSQGTSYVLRPDPGRTRHTGARFVRPEGEPSLIKGVALIAPVFAVIALAAVIFG